MNIRNAQNDLDNVVKELDYEGRANSRWVECMNYSPDGQYLAVGNHDSNIYIYETSDYKLIGKCTGHTAAVLDLDWDKESTILRTFSLSYDLLYYTNKGERIKNAYECKDTDWSSQTCK